MVNDHFRPLYPQELIYEHTERIYSFKAANANEFYTWKKEFRNKLIELLGGFPDKKVDLAPELISVKDLGSYTRHKIIIYSTENTRIPLYLLIPKNLEKRVPAMIAVPGHGYGKDDIVGLWEDGAERSFPEGYQMHFAVELVKRGFIVIAPEMPGFGERREERQILLAPEINSCKDASLLGILQGKTLMGMRVYDIKRCIDYLETMSDVDTQKIGVMGISGGGTASMYAGALDDRINAVVMCGCLGSYKGLEVFDHCLCNYIPGILKYGEMADVAALIAPKALFVENGDRDIIFHIKTAIKSYDQVRKVYELLGAADKIDSDFFEGRHVINGAKCYNWLVKLMFG